MTASNRRAWRRDWSARPSGSASACTTGRRSGTSPARVCADEPKTAATAPSASRPRALTSPFNASANGANGSPPSPRSRQPPTSVRVPPADARARSSAISRLLPTPASPATRTSDGRPEAAASTRPAGARARAAGPRRSDCWYAGSRAPSWVPRPCRTRGTGEPTRSAGPPSLPGGRGSRVLTPRTGAYLVRHAVDGLREIVEADRAVPWGRTGCPASLPLERSDLVRHAAVGGGCGQGAPGGSWLSSPSTGATWCGTPPTQTELARASCATGIAAAPATDVASSVPAKTTPRPSDRSGLPLALCAVWFLMSASFSCPAPAGLVAACPITAPARFVGFDDRLIRGSRLATSPDRRR